MLQSLSPDRLKNMIDVFDRQYDGIPALDGPPLYGVPVWDMPYIIGDENPENWFPWLECIGYAGYMEHEIRGRPDYLDVEHSPKQGMIRRCSLLVDQTHIPISMVAVFRVNEAVFFSDIARRLNVTREKSTRVLLEDHVWELGAVSLGPEVSFPVYVVRQLYRERDAIIEALSKNNAHGLVLLSGKDNPVHQRWPAGIEVQRLWEVIAGGSLRFEMSQSLLNTGDGVLVDKPITVQPVKNTVIKNPGNIDPERSSSSFDEIKNYRGETIIAYDWGNHVLSIPEKPDWHLEGLTRQAAIVEFMFDKAKSGLWRVLHKDLMLATKPLYGGSRHISNVFTHNNDWVEYIVSIVRGEWGFNVEHD